MARKIVTFAGSNTLGAISVPGTKAGDVIVSAVAVENGSDRSSFFAKFVLADDEMLQTSGQAGVTLIVLLDRELVI